MKKYILSKYKDILGGGSNVVMREGLPVRMRDRKRPRHPSESPLDDMRMPETPEEILHRKGQDHPSSVKDFLIKYRSGPAFNLGEAFPVESSASKELKISYESMSNSFIGLIFKK